MSGRCDAAATMAWAALSTAGRPRPRWSWTIILKPPPVPMPRTGGGMIVIMNASWTDASLWFNSLIRASADWPLSARSSNGASPVNIAPCSAHW